MISKQCFLQTCMLSMLEVKDKCLFCDRDVESTFLQPVVNRRIKVLGA